MAIDIIARGMVESSKSDISQLFDMTRGGEIVNNESAYTISNAVDYPLMGLNLYGKSTQDGTPTPDNPVDIVSVGDSGSINIKSCGKNLLNYDAWKTNNVIIHGTAIFENNGVTITATQEDAYTPHFNKYFPELAKVFVMEGETITLSWEESTNKSGRVYIYPNGGEDGRVLCDNRLQKKLTYTVPSGVTFITFRFGVSSSGDTISYKNIMIERGSEATAYEPYKGTTASITSALPLCGIPVASGGNYTDNNGQQWICDELIYNADGTGKIVKHTVNTIITSDGATLSSTNNVIANSSYNMPYPTAESGVHRFKLALSGLDLSFIVNNDNSVLCSAYEFKKGNNNTWFRTAQFGADVDAIWFCDPDNFNTLDEFFNFIKNNPMELVYPLAEPQEIPLTAAEMAELRQLMTYSGTTDISNSDNADMDVKYCTNKTLSECVMPITTALQTQIDELKSAVLSLGGNV